MKGFGDIYKSKLNKNKVKKNNLTDDQIISLAINNHAKGNIPEAIKYYNIAISKGFANDVVFANFSLILQDSGNLNGAEISARKVIPIWL